MFLNLQLVNEHHLHALGFFLVCVRVVGGGGGFVAGRMINKKIFAVKFNKEKRYLV